MAPSKSNTSNKIIFNKKETVSRPGVHSKTKASNHKQAKNYLKRYKGQGR